MNYKKHVNTKWRNIFIIIAVLLTSILSFPKYTTAADLADYSELDLRLNIFNQFTTSGRIDNVSAKVSYYPKSDDRQTISNTISIPKPTVDSDMQQFVWHNPTNNVFTVNITAEVNTKNFISKVDRKVEFPLTNIENYYFTYMQPTNIIDVNDDIKKLASELIQGKTDLYEIEYTFAEYVRKNIAYDLGTVTETANQKSSWVLENKKGVCDEISNLFASLNRAVGIPVRFVSGVAHTNLDIFGSEWVPHAWTEVYFPEYGWVPFDVTYGQYAFIDSGHIKLGDSFDSGGSNIRYEYTGKDASLKPGPIMINVTTIAHSTLMKARYDFVVSMYKEDVGFNSYDIVFVDVTNSENYYQVADIYLANVEDVDIVEETQEKVLNKQIHRKEVFLKPRESKRISWIVKLDGDFNNKYIYKFPMIVYNSYNETSTVYMNGRNGKQTFSLMEVFDIIGKETESLPYNRFVSLDCKTSANELYINETIEIKCSFNNIGAQAISGTICSNECFNITGSKDVIFKYRYMQPGVNNIIIKAKGLGFDKNNYISINVLDKPQLLLTNINYPISVNYGDDFNISFEILKESLANAQNVSVIVKGPVSVNDWYFNVFTQPRGFVIDSNGKFMKNDDNKYTISVQYFDLQGKSYEMQKEFTIKSKANVIEKVLLLFNSVGYFVESLVK